MKNLEIKAKYKNHAKLRKLLEKIGTRFIEKKRQIDTYFIVPHGRLKLREKNSGISDLIYYKRGEKTLKRWSNYYLYHSSSPKELKKILSRVFLVSIIVDKQRTIYRYKNARVHIDKVKKMGNFMEIEVEVKKGENQAKNLMEELLNHLRIPQRNFIRQSYSDLLMRK